MALGGLLVAVSLGIAIYSIYADERAGKNSAIVLTYLEEHIPTPDVDETDDGNGTDSRALYVQHPDMEMPTMTVDDNGYIGILEIPDLDLKLPVMGEWSYPGLNISPCRYTGSAYLNNLVIAGHSYQSHFGRLDELQIGAEVKFTDVDGNIFLYRVAESEVLKPTAIDEMVDNVWDLTLFTCTYTGKARYTVRCELVQ
jgi:sortase A